MTYCKNCGNPIQDGMRVCPRCGAETPKTENSMPQVQPKVHRKINVVEKVIALVLVFALLATGAYLLFFNTDDAKIKKRIAAVEKAYSNQDMINLIDCVDPAYRETILINTAWKGEYEFPDEITSGMVKPKFEVVSIDYVDSVHANVTFKLTAIYTDGSSQQGSEGTEEMVKNNGKWYIGEDFFKDLVW